MNRKQYSKVLKRGCGGYRDYFGEYDCKHRYEWSCDYCPIVTEKYRRETEERDRQAHATKLAPLDLPQSLINLSGLGFKSFTPGGQNK